MEPTNLNILLESYIDSGRTDQVQKLVDCSLDTCKTLQLIRRTKQYSLLLVLLPVLKITLPAEEIVKTMYLDALRDNNAEAIEILSKFDLYEDYMQELSLVCGKEGYKPKLLGRHFSLSGYVTGIIQADNLERFLLVHKNYGSSWVEGGIKKDVREILSRYFAPTILDHIGYDSETLVYYLINVALLKNKKLLAFLWPKEHTQKAFFACLLLKDEQYRASVLQWVLKQGFNLSEETWLAIKAKMPDVYHACYQDV